MATCITRLLRPMVVACGARIAVRTMMALSALTSTGTLATNGATTTSARRPSVPMKPTVAPKHSQSPETQALKEFCESKTFTIALNYHSYSNLLLYPWGYFTLPSPDDHIFFEHARRMTSNNGYVYGPSSTTIYSNNGGSDDWMYGDTSTKPAIFAYTPEVGSVNDGFWPDINRIIPQCQENMLQSLMAAHFSMKYAEVKMLSSTVVSSFDNNLDFSIRRLGFQDESEFTVFLQSLSGNVTVTSDPIVFTDMALLETRSGQIDFVLDPATPGGTFFSLLLGVDNGHYIRYDTLKMIFGIEQSAFFDDCSNLSQWTGNWGLSTVHFTSPPSSITDSPTGNYPFLGSRTTTTINAIDLSDAAAAFVRFNSRWDINGNGAYVQVRVSNNGGNTWIPMAGKFTRPGLPNAVAGQPVYSDKQLHWVSEEIDLSQFAGDQILIRFHLSSNSWGVATADGLYFDDIGVYKVLPLAPVNAGFSAGSTLIMQGSGVQFEDQSVGNVNSWSWEFEGGEPVVSSQQNPLVFYTDGGVFDVKLIAGNGGLSDTLLLQNHITVLDSILCRPAIFAGGNTWIQPGQTYNTSTATAENFSSLRWTSSGDGQFENDTLLHTTYTPGSADENAGEVRLILTASPVYDLCETVTDTLILLIDEFSGTVNSALQQITIHPNPAGEYANISFPHVVNQAYIEVSDINGRLIKELAVNNTQHIYFPAGSLKQGIYILKISTAEGFYATRLAIIR
jgi:PKD repeat protein